MLRLENILQINWLIQSLNSCIYSENNKMLISKIILARFFAIVDTSQPNFIHVVLRSPSRQIWKGRSWKIVRHFTSDSATLWTTTLWKKANPSKRASLSSEKLRIWPRNYFTSGCWSRVLTRRRGSSEASPSMEPNKRGSLIFAIAAATLGPGRNTSAFGPLLCACAEGQKRISASSFLCIHSRQKQSFPVERKGVKAIRGTQGRTEGTQFPGRRKVPTTSQVLSSIHYIYSQKTLGSNMGVPNLLLDPGAVWPRYAPVCTCQSLLRYEC